MGFPRGWPIALLGSSTPAAAGPHPGTETGLLSGSSVPARSAGTSSAMAASTGAPFRFAVVLAHGAGAPSSHPWMVAWKERLQTLEGCALCHSFDFPGVRKAEKLAPHYWEAARETLRLAGPVDALFFAGKSMGSRVGCISLGAEHHAADVEVDDSGTPLLSGVPIRGVLAFGYPLKGGGSFRTAPLEALPVPAFFCTGDRDPMGPLPELRAAIDSMPCAASCVLHTVETGNHSCEAQKSFLKRNDLTQDDVHAASLAAAARFVAQTMHEAAAGPAAKAMAKPAAKAKPATKPASSAAQAAPAAKAQRLRGKASPAPGASPARAPKRARAPSPAPKADEAASAAPVSSRTKRARARSAAAKR